MKKKTLTNPSKREEVPEERHYVVTIGLTRRLVEAVDEDSAREKTLGLVTNPEGSMRSLYRRVVVTDDEVLVREATPEDIAEFTKTRKRRLAPGDAEGLFDVNTVPIDRRKRQR